MATQENFNWGLASGGYDEHNAPVQLFAGEAAVITDSAEAALDGEATFAKHEVAVLNADGTLTKLTDELVAGEAGDGTVTEGEIGGFPVPGVTGASCVITAIGGADEARIPYYAAGRFNHAALVWPASLDDLAKRKAFFHGTPISVAHLN